MHYILIGKNPVQVDCDDFVSWSKWFSWQATNGARHVAIDKYQARKPITKGHPRMIARLNHYRKQEIMVSTVFLGLDHNHFGGVPILFETMIFGGINDGVQWRYHDWDEAAEGHEEIKARYL